ncbi:hypothetical protein [Pelosinus propionicus]|nr:hypothetical protein [Pelosinus propionicus]
MRDKGICDLPIHEPNRFCLWSRYDYLLALEAVADKISSVS